MKKIILMSLIVISSIVLCSCVPLWWDNVPTQQKENTKWVSDDEKIELYCDNRAVLIGYLNVDDEKIKIDCSVDYSGRFKISSISDYVLPDNYSELNLEEKNSIADEICETIIEYESGNGTYHKNSFTVTFDKTTYLEPGEKITFHKVEWTGLPEDLTADSDAE